MHRPCRARATRLLTVAAGQFISRAALAWSSSRNAQRSRARRRGSGKTAIASPVDDSVVRALGKLVKLREFHLPGASITNVGLDAIGELPSLRELDISRCQGVDDAGVRRLLARRELTSLRLTGTGVTQAIVAALLATPSLRELHLEFDWVTPAIRRRLAALPGMKNLQVSRR